MTSTKEQILFKALDLFAEKGFDGTSIDMIANAVGIKGPSLYKHYKNKDEILDALISKIEEYYIKRMDDAGKKDKYPENLDQMSRLIMAKINFTMHDPLIKKSRITLMQEQFRNPRIAELATKRSLTGIVMAFKQLFEIMIDSGVLIKEDPGLMALEFISPITLFIQICDRQPAKEKEILKHVKSHIKFFCKIYGKK